MEDSKSHCEAGSGVHCLLLASSTSPASSCFVHFGRLVQPLRTYLRPSNRLFPVLMPHLRSLRLASLASLTQLTAVGPLLIFALLCLLIHFTARRARRGPQSPSSPSSTSSRSIEYKPNLRRQEYRRAARERFGVAVPLPDSASGRNSGGRDSGVTRVESRDSDAPPTYLSSWGDTTLESGVMPPAPVYRAEAHVPSWSGVTPAPAYRREWKDEGSESSCNVGSGGSGGSGRGMRGGGGGSVEGGGAEASHRGSGEGRTRGSGGSLDSVDFLRCGY